MFIVYKWAGKSCVGNKFEGVGGCNKLDYRWKTSRNGCWRTAELEEDMESVTGRWADWAGAYGVHTAGGSASSKQPPTKVVRLHIAEKLRAAFSF